MLNNTGGFDRHHEDLGNVVHLEHLNLAVPDQLLATRFYVSALGLTRDPYMMTGVENMWINAGATQFHLPTRGTQRLRGTVVLIVPGRSALCERLRRAAPGLAGTAFAFTEHGDHVAVTCPWGNRLHCVEPDVTLYGAMALGIAQVMLDVPQGAAEGIARFYRHVFATRAGTASGPAGLPAARVQVGASQSLLFCETAVDVPEYDGHHIQIYVADFSGPHRRLAELGLVTEESNQHQYRFLDIADPQSRMPLFRLEHEVRSMTHPLYARPLVNRNPQQNDPRYVRGRDAFIP